MKRRIYACTNEYCTRRRSISYICHTLKMSPSFECLAFTYSNAACSIEPEAEFSWIRILLDFVIGDLKEFYWENVLSSIYILNYSSTRNSRVCGILITGKWLPYNLNASKLMVLLELVPCVSLIFLLLLVASVFKQFYPRNEIATELLHSPSERYA